MKHLLLAATAAFAPAAFADPSCHFEASFAGDTFMTADYLVTHSDYAHGLREFLASPFYVSLVEPGLAHDVSLTATVSYFHQDEKVARLVEETIYPLTYSIFKHKFVASLNPLKIANCTAGVCDVHASYAFVFHVDGKDLINADSGTSALTIDLSKAPNYCQFPAPNEP